MIMIHITRTVEFPRCGTLDLDLMNTANQDLTSVANGRGRQRSHSYTSAEDAKNYGLHAETEKVVVRPRSRYAQRSSAYMSYWLLCCLFPPWGNIIMLLIFCVILVFDHLVNFSSTN